MRRRLGSTRINQVLEADNIALDVGAGVLKGIPNPRLRREMDNAVKICWANSESTICPSARSPLTKENPE